MLKKLWFCDKKCRSQFAKSQTFLALVKKKKKKKKKFVQLLRI